jgi:aminoglycoside phosphotransferase (APT) family kinase protein
MLHGWARRKTKHLLHSPGRKRLKKELDRTEVDRICARHQIEIRQLDSVAGSFAKRIFFINRQLLLRVSETPMTLEQEKFNRVATLNFVPKIIHAGVLEREGGSIYYTLLTLLPGDDFVNAYRETTLAQQTQLGRDVANFLDGLQELTGTHYDIGLYIAVIPQFTGTWRAGHQRYWEILEQGCAQLSLTPEGIQIFASAFQFLRASAAALDFQTGPKLLHNDFHPGNLLLSQGKFSGVIDWECSQYGEADFELCHLIHWCVYPPQPGIDYRPFLRALFRSAPKCTQVPDLARRLTIYQVEHEIQQFIWQAGKSESLRVPRLAHWLAGGVDDLLGEITGQ